MNEFMRNQQEKSKKIIFRNCIICNKPPKVGTFQDGELLKCNACEDIRTCKGCLYDY